MTKQVGKFIKCGHCYRVAPPPRSALRVLGTRGRESLRWLRPGELKASSTQGDVVTHSYQYGALCM